MEPYRLYVLDPLTGRIDHEHRVVAEDDETAVWISEGLKRTRPMELWLGRCKIHCWDAIERPIFELKPADNSPDRERALLVN